MPKLVVTGFDGIYPRVSATALQPNAATIAQNVKLYAGELRRWRGPTLDFTTANGGPVYSIFKIYNSSGTSTWLTWAGLVDAVMGPLADTNEIRVYYTGAGSPRKTNWSKATGGSQPYPSDYMEMGVPAPASAPTVGVTGGSSTAAETRAYVYTYVSTFGSVKEESAPSPASSLINLGVSQAGSVGSFATAPTTSAKYNITALRIYRTYSGSTLDSASYAYVDEIAVNPATGQIAASGTSTGGVSYSSSTYVDNLTSVQLGEELATTTWSTPPSDLTGIVAMANGILAGFSGNSVYFSEPYYPHAWPLAYMLTVPDRIVGLGAFGSSLVVCTDNYPYLISGSTSDSMSQERLPLPEPCVSKRSIVSDQFGVTYASPNGLVSIGSGNRGLVTQKLFLRDEFQVYNPSSIIGAVYDNKYFGFFNSPTLGRAAFCLSREDIPAMSMLQASANGVHVDNKNGALYYTDITNNNIYRYDANDAAPQTYTWQSKRFLTDHGLTWSALKVDGDYSAGGSVTIYLYGDSGLATTLTVSSFDPVRIPAFRAREVQIKATGTLNVRSITLATSVQELRS